MRRFFIASLLVTAAAFAQTGPVLHSRREHAQEPRASATKAVSTLPEDASGEYELDEHGSVIEITIERGHLSGYVTKMEHETALTLFFERTTANGNRLSFATKTVHGLRYSFHGAVLRGDAASPAISGFYRLVGDLTIERNGANQAEHVSLKSTPRLGGRE